MQETLAEDTDPLDWDSFEGDFTSTLPPPTYTRFQDEHEFLRTGPTVGVNVSGGSNVYEQGGATTPGIWKTWRYSATQTITASWSAQYLFNTTDGQYSFPPGLGAGVSLTIMNDFDQPVFTTTIGAGKYGLVSVGVIEGYNIFSGLPDFAGLVVTGGVGVTFPPSPVSFQKPQ